MKNIISTFVATNDRQDEENAVENVIGGGKAYKDTTETSLLYP